MKVFNIKVCTYIKTLVNFIFRFVCKIFRRKTKLKTGDEDVKPIKIQIDHGGEGTLFTGIESSPMVPSYQTRYQKAAEEKDKMVDWSEWNDKFDNQSETSVMENDSDVVSSELFKDMEPVISRPKMVRLKQNTANSIESTRPREDDKFRIDGNCVNIQTELGTWVDEPVGWDQDEIDDNEISRESSRLLKEKKRLEREQRAQEQLRKKQEKEAMRQQKRMTGHLGVKIN